MTFWQAEIEFGGDPSHAAVEGAIPEEVEIVGWDEPAGEQLVQAGKDYWLPARASVLQVEFEADDQSGADAVVGRIVAGLREVGSEAKVSTLALTTAELMEGDL